MSRILHNDEWYEEIASKGHYESEYENILMQNATELFENYFLVPFKTPVFSEYDNDVRKPDFALIHKGYHSWWVVEVELAHHSLGNHVVPQVQTIARAQYGEKEVNYLCQHGPELNRDKVVDMFKGDQPRVLVIVNSPVKGWADMLRPLGVVVVICQIFRSKLNRYLLRINGEYPSDENEVLTTCTCNQYLHRMLSVNSPARLPINGGESVLVYYEGLATEWERVDTSDQVFLLASRDHSLEPGNTYEILRQGDETLAFRRRSNRNL